MNDLPYNHSETQHTSGNNSRCLKLYGLSLEDAVPRCAELVEVQFVQSFIAFRIQEWCQDVFEIIPLLNHRNQSNSGTNCNLHVLQSWWHRLHKANAVLTCFKRGTSIKQ